VRFIQKNKEPSELLQYRQQPGASFLGLNLEQKQAIRESLVREQGYLCCYCMKRIEPTSGGMKIEHWAPQSGPNGDSLQLRWINLLGACNGNQDKCADNQHCDTKKANTPLQINPMEKRCEDLIRFRPDGSIWSEDPNTNRDLNQVLNLNLNQLKNNRKGVYKNFHILWTKVPTEDWSERFLNKKICDLSTPKDGKLTEYCQVSIYILQKKLRRLRPSRR
jgi:uncharacterized protein (TIGR02646 family)